MEEERVSPMQVAMKWGLYTGVILVIFDLILYLLGMKSADGSNPIQYLGFVLMIAMLVMGIKAYRDANNTMSYGQGLGTGVLTSLVAGLIVAVYTYLFMTVIAPEFMDSAMDAMRDQWEDQGLGDEEIEAAEGMVSMFMSPGIMSFLSILSYGLMLQIIGLIINRTTLILR